MKIKKKTCNENDFLISDLPKNRVQLFFDILKNQWSSLLILSFTTLLVFMLLIISRYQNISIISNIISSDMENKNYHIQFAYFIHYAINIVIIIIIGIYLSGMMRVFKKMSYNEGFFLGADFFKGVKENIKEYLIIYTIYGILCFMVESLSINYLMADSMLYYLFKIINYGFLLPILLICSCLSTIYSDNIFKKIKISFLLYIKNFFKIIFALIIMICPLLSLIMGSTIVQLFVPIIYCLIYLPLSLLGFLIMMNGVFDKYINKENFPDLVNKGMYVKK